MQHFSGQIQEAVVGPEARLEVGTSLARSGGEMTLAAGSHMLERDSVNCWHVFEFTPSALKTFQLTQPTV